MLHTGMFSFFKKTIIDDVINFILKYTTSTSSDKPLDIKFNDSGNVILIQTTSGLKKSIDGGNTFNYIYTNPTGYDSYNIITNNSLSHILHVYKISTSTSDFHFIYSNDGGVTFTEKSFSIFNTGGQNVKGAFTNDGNKFIGFSYSGITDTLKVFSYTNDLTTKTELTSGLPSAGNYRDIRISGDGQKIAIQISYTNSSFPAGFVISTNGTSFSHVSLAGIQKFAISNDGSSLYALLFISTYNTRLFKSTNFSTFTEIASDLYYTNDINTNNDGQKVIVSNNNASYGGCRISETGGTYFTQYINESGEYGLKSGISGNGLHYGLIKAPNNAPFKVYIS